MDIAIKSLIFLIAAAHFYFMYFEMMAWESMGKKIFRSIPENMFVVTKKMAANQGLYNGFIGAGLIWSLIINDEIWSKNIAFFFLTCVLVAGVFGAWSISKKIFYIQALPAIIAIILLFL